LPHLLKFAKKKIGDVELFKDEN